MANNMKNRVCRECGAVFLGGPRAWYCPDCRAERIRAQYQRYRYRVARPLGTTDRCQICGKPYVVIGGLQRYCKDCAETAIREKDRQQSMAYYLKHREKIMEQKKKSTSFARNGRTKLRSALSAANPLWYHTTTAFIARTSAGPYKKRNLRKSGNARKEPKENKKAEPPEGSSATIDYFFNASV